MKFLNTIIGTESKGRNEDTGINNYFILFLRKSFSLLI